MLKAINENSEYTNKYIVRLFSVLPTEEEPCIKIVKGNSYEHAINVALENLGYKGNLVTRKKSSQVFASVLLYNTIDTKMVYYAINNLRKF